MKRQQHCFNCGEGLGFFDSWGERHLTCGRSECEKEARYQQQSEDAEARFLAEQDDYSAYR